MATAAKVDFRDVRIAELEAALRQERARATALEQRAQHFESAISRAYQFRLRQAPHEAESRR